MAEQPGADDAGSVGSMLRRARERAGLSLADVAGRTRLRQVLVEDIEADRFERCGGEVYARGHVKTLARVVGVSEELALRAFVQGPVPTQVAGAPAPAASPVAVPTGTATNINRASAPARSALARSAPARLAPAAPTGPAARPAPVAASAAPPLAGAVGSAMAGPRRPGKVSIDTAVGDDRVSPERALSMLGGRRISVAGPRWNLLLAVALVVVAGFGMFRLSQGGGQNTPAPVIAAPSVLPSTTPKVSPSSSPVSSRPPSASASPSQTVVAVIPTGIVVVQIVGQNGKSWVSARSSAGASLFQGLLAVGDRKTFTDPASLAVTIGNAGAVRLVVNGKDLGAPGGSGQVLRLTFKPGDPTLSQG